MGIVGRTYEYCTSRLYLPNFPEQMVSAYLMKAWATFADDPQNGLSERLGWPRYDPAEATLVRLAYQDQTEASFVSPGAYDGPCAALAGDLSAGEGAF